MEQLLRDKYRREPELRERLAQTGTRTLVNLLQSDARFGGSTTNALMAGSDAVSKQKLLWGKVPATGSSESTNGQNRLGTLLEKVRLSCLNETEIDDWIRSSVKLMEGDVGEIPPIRMDVYKEGQQIETINLTNRTLFRFGRGIGQ